MFNKLLICKRLGEESWQTGTGLNEDEIIVEVTMAVNPAIVWKELLEPTTREIFDLPKGKKGTAANVWGDMFMTNDALHEKMMQQRRNKDEMKRLNEPSYYCNQLVPRLHCNGQPALLAKMV